MTESTQKKLSRVRPPRVQITYDVETGGAIVMKELPLVVGILADLAGKPEKPLPPLKRRKFIELDRDNFNQVMTAIGPHLTFAVDNKLDSGEKTDEEGGDKAQEEGGEKKAGTKLAVDLTFRRIEDLRPESIVQQLEPLRKLFEARQRLNDLLAKLDGNDDLDALLQEVAANTESQQKIKEATTTGGTSNGS